MSDGQGNGEQVRHAIPLAVVGLVQAVLVAATTGAFQYFVAVEPLKAQLAAAQAQPASRELELAKSALEDSKKQLSEARKQLESSSQDPVSNIVLAAGMTAIYSQKQLSLEKCRERARKLALGAQARMIQDNVDWTKWETAGVLHLVSCGKSDDDRGLYAAVLPATSKPNAPLILDQMRNTVFKGVDE